jgi:methionyl-tRNA formyltransferase
MRIVFMGTPEFAIPCLEALNENFDVVAVVTAPDKTGGRGHKIIESPIKKWAEDKKLLVLQPERLKSRQFIAQLKELRPDLQVVVAFRMLPEVVWNIPPLGTINLHGSLLPKYRGAAPIQRAIMAGEIETGLTTFKLTHEIDTGDIIDYCKLEIKPDETAGELHDKMKYAGARLLMDTVKKIANGNVDFKKQDATLASEAPKIFSGDCEINWNGNVDTIYNQIRGLAPYPGAWFKKENHTYKIIAARKINEIPIHSPGEWYVKDKKNFWIATLDGYISVLEIQQEGRNKLRVDQFINGLRILP